MAKKDIEVLIDNLEIYIDNCKYQTLSQNKIIVNKNELLEMLDEIKQKLPMEIERCKKIMRNKEAILADARTRSDAIISESVNEANRLVDQHQITELANVRANEILDQARSEAQQIMSQANEEATEVRLGAMYYTKDKLGEVRDIFKKIHDVESENYRTLIESLESDSYVVETNMSEMEANINLLTASSNMSYQMTDDIDDSAYADSVQQPIRNNNSSYDDSSDSDYDGFDDEYDDEEDFLED